MLTDGIQLLGSSNASNFSIEAGSAFPASGSIGELFYKTGIGLHVYSGSSWDVIGGDTVDSASIIAALGYTPAALDGSSKVLTTQLPNLAITDTFVVATQVAMLALTAEVGDVAVRTDLNKSFILKTAGASTLANWQELLTPTQSVLSVNGLTGAVVLTSTNITEGTRLYYTDARARAAISVTGGGSYDSATGIITINTNTTTATNLAGGGTNQIPYQSSANNTAFSQALTFNPTGVSGGLPALKVGNTTDGYISGQSNFGDVAGYGLHVQGGIGSSAQNGSPIGGDLYLEGGYATSSGTPTGGTVAGGNVQILGGMPANVGTSTKVGGYIVIKTGASTALVERLRITNNGAWSVGSTGIAYGTSGQVLTSAGNAPPTWTTPAAAASGTVTSVAVSGGTTGLTTSGGPITVSGTITLAGTLVIANGGTGLSTIGANGTVLTSNGSTASWSAPSGSSFSGGTVSGATTFTSAAPQVTLNNATANIITMSAAGIDQPRFTTRSVGTKIVLFDNITSSLFDYAIGVETNTVWFSVANTTSGWKWYSGSGALNTAMALSGTGVLTVPTLTVSGITTHTGATTLTGAATFSSTIIAGGSAGSAGNVLTSTGTGVQWAAPGGATTLYATGAAPIGTAVSQVTVGRDNASQPLVAWTNAGATATQRITYAFVNSAGTFVIGALSDDAQTAGTTWLTVTRSGTTAGTITLTSTALALNISGSVGTSGQVLTSNGTTASWAAAAGSSLAATQVGYGSTGNALTSSSAFTYDATAGTLKIGGAPTNTTATGLQVSDTATASKNVVIVGSSGFTGIVSGWDANATNNSGSALALRGGAGNGTGNGAELSLQGGRAGTAAGSSGTISFYTAPAGTGTTLVQRLRITTLGAFSFGATDTAYGTSGQVLTSAGANGPPTWTTVSGSSTLTATQVGFGSAGNTETGSTKFTWTDASALLTLGASGAVAGITAATGSSAFTITGGSAGTGPGGTVTILGGSPSVTPGSGGGVTLTGAQSLGTGTGGNINIFAGAGTTTNGSFGGAVNISGGQGNATQALGGKVTISGGSANATTGQSGGNVDISGGAGSTATAGSFGGVASLTGGLTQSTGASSGGDARVVGGNSTGTGGVGGNAQVTAGNGTSTGGQVNITSGTGASSGGYITFTTSASTTQVERFRITNFGAWSLGATGTATGTANQVLTSSGSGGPPTWTTPASTLIPENLVSAATTAYTLVLTDQYVTMQATAANTVTIPLNSSVPFPIGTRIDVVQMGSGKTTIAPGGAVTINSVGTQRSVGAQYGAITLIKRGTDTWLLIGNLAA